MKALRSGTLQVAKLAKERVKGTRRDHFEWSWLQLKATMHNVVEWLDFNVSEDYLYEQVLSIMLELRNGLS
jgi:hypothetical protein